MTFPSHSSSVPPFHSLGNGTVEQTLNHRNSSRNVNGTSSLKTLANKVLERNKQGNNPGTAASKAVPHLDQNVPLHGTNLETNCAQYDDLSYAFEERAAIMEYDGGLTRQEAERRARIDIELGKLSLRDQG